MEWMPLCLFAVFGALFTYLHITVEGPEERRMGENAVGSLSLAYAWLGWSAAALFAVFKLAGWL